MEISCVFCLDVTNAVEIVGAQLYHTCITNNKHWVEGMSTRLEKMYITENESLIV